MAGPPGPRLPVAGGRQLQLDGCCSSHLSDRVPGPGHHFLRNPINLMFEEVIASSLVKVHRDFNNVMDTLCDTNPAGFTIHSAAHSCRQSSLANTREVHRVPNGAHNFVEASD